MPKLLPRVDIVIRGPHDSGRTTLAHVIENFLEENGYEHVSVKDTPPLPQEQKAAFWDRFTRNRVLRPIQISVELDETKKCMGCVGLSHHPDCPLWIPVY